MVLANFTPGKFGKLHSYVSFLKRSQSFLKKGLVLIALENAIARTLQRMP